jgi:hypothetical protein
MRTTPLALLFALAPALSAPAQSPAPPTLDRYNLVWTSPGRDAAGSMPIGNGETGLNVWVEEGGDLCFYISRTDAWSETDRLLKLGRIRISFSPNPFEAERPFRQELNLREGRIDITADEPATKLGVFVHAIGPDIHIIGELAPPAAPATITATLETWRTEKKTFENDDELRSSWTMHSAPADVRREIVWEAPDVLVPDPDPATKGIIWYHRNEHSIVPFTLKHQGLESISDEFKDPLLHRTFGGRLSGEGFAPIDGRLGAIGTGKPVSSFALRITTHSAQTPTIDAWLQQLAALDAGAPPAPTSRAATARWWREFWDRSWIFVENDTAPSRAGAAGPVPRNDHPLRIGADSKGENLYRGQMLSVEVYERALSGSEIGLRERPASFPTPWAMWAPNFRTGRKLEPSVGNVPLRAVGEARADLWAPDGYAMIFDGGHFEVPAAAAPAFTDGFTLIAHLGAHNSAAPARIIDKITAGGSDGFLFDTHPGDALRLIVGSRTLHAPRALAEPMWRTVAATYDAATGRMAIYINGRLMKESPAGASDAPPPSRVTQAYILQRWIAACCGRRVSGDLAFPIKFNGSIFTVEPVFTQGQPFNADWRKWGGCFWWQNTRLPYYPMLACGDFDLMDPLFRFYEGAAPACAARARLYHHAAGVYFPETITTFGTYSNGDYGWDRTGASAGDVHCPWWQWAWQQGLELAQLMLDYARYTGDERFLVERAIPMANQALSWYDTRFARDGAGKLVISPTQAVETYWHDVVNDAPSVGGLHAVCDMLLALPPGVGSSRERELWRRMKDAAPGLPTWEIGGTVAAAPAEKFKNQRNNCETPELYPLFPFRQYGLGKPGLDAAIAAYHARVDKSNVGWTQDGMFAAMLGLTEEARANLLAKAASSHTNFRFPAMWGPNFDWLPDQCHGSNLMTTLQLMLMQCDGDEIRLLPAWPREWDVSFKLHAPKRTTVECVYRGGKIEKLVVTPEGRRADVIGAAIR